MKEHSHKALEKARLKYNGMGFSAEIGYERFPILHSVVDELVKRIERCIRGMRCVLLTEPDSLLTLALQLTRK